MTRTNEISEGLKPILDLLKIEVTDQDTALSSLQVCVKYLLFDNEALTRERNWYMEKVFKEGDKND